MEKQIDILISEVHEYTSEAAEAVRKLAQQEGKNYKTLSDDDFREMISSPNLTLFIATDKDTDQIVGMVTLIVQRIPYVKKATMEDLVVDELYRGYGIGTKLIKQVVLGAEEKGASYLDFSSRPRREGENAFYERLGFQKRETNVYRHIINYNEV